VLSENKSNFPYSRISKTKPKERKAGTFIFAKNVAKDESRFMVITQKLCSCPSARADHLHIPK
jgi:hypothetical protein